MHVRLGPISISIFSISLWHFDGFDHDCGSGDNPTVVGSEVAQTDCNLFLGIGIALGGLLTCDLVSGPVLLLALCTAVQLELALSTATEQAAVQFSKYSAVSTSWGCRLRRGRFHVDQILKEFDGLRGRLLLGDVQNSLKDRKRK